MDWLCIVLERFGGSEVDFVFCEFCFGCIGIFIGVGSSKIICLVCEGESGRIDELGVPNMESLVMYFLSCG